jgi:hypothetical protein
MPDFSARKLGRVATTTNRLAALPLFPDYTSKLPPPPPAVTWSDKVQSWPMMQNDQYGDCTCATVGHIIQLWTAANRIDFVPSDQDVLGMYSAVTGFTPDDPNTDNGAVMLDVLQYWKNTGMAGHRLTAFARVRVGHHDAVKSAIQLMGAVCLGIAMPAAWQQAQTWDVARGRDGVPGSWGGHEVPAVDYDDKGVTVVTWGELVKLTWGAFDKYVEEAQVPVDDDWADSDGAPSGFSLDELLADMGYLQGRRVA